jgi:ATP-dependent RNA helicase DeaD
MRVTLKSGEFQKQEHLLARLLEEGFSTTDIASACLAQLQSSEAASPKPAPREEANERPRGSSFRGRESREERYDDRPPRHERLRDDDRRPSPAIRERRDPAPPRREASAPLRPKVLAPVAPAPAKPKPAAPVVSTAPIEPKAPVAPTTPVVPTAPVAPKPAVAPTTPTESKALVAPGKSVIPSAIQSPSERRPLPLAKPKASRATPSDFTRLYMNLGTEHGLAAGDVVGAILGETGLPAKNVGVIDLRERHSFFDVAAENANAIIAKLNRAQIKGRKVKVKVA